MFSSPKKQIKSSKTIMNPKHSFLNSVKKPETIEKKQHSLVDYLYKKYAVKYNLKGVNSEVMKEIQNYSKSINSSADLSNLDKLIDIIVGKRKSSSVENSARNSVVLSNIVVSPEVEKKVAFETKIEDPLHKLSQREQKRGESRDSRMSGASELSNYAATKNRRKDASDKMNQINTLLKSQKKVNEEPIDIQGNEWSMVAQYNKQLAEKEKENQLRKSKETKLMIKNELEKQMYQKKVVRNQEMEEDIQLKSKIMQNVRQFEQEKQQHKLETLRKSRELKELRDKLLQDEKKRKQEEFSKEREKDLEIIRMVKEKERKDKERLDNKKLNELNLYKKVSEENAVLQQLKREIEMKEKEYEEKIEQENKQIAVRMEKERQVIKQKATNFNQRSFDLLKDIYKQKEQEAKDLENNLVMSIKNSIEKIEKKEESKKTQENGMRKVLKDVYEQQIKQRDEIKKKEIQEDKDLASIWNKDYNDFLEKNRINQQRQSESYRKNNEFLKNQIEIKKLKKANDMTSHELSVNKDILKAYLNPQL